MLLSTKRNTLARKEIQVKDNEKDNFCEILLPTNIRISIPMSLWNVLSNNYSILVQVKTAAHKNPVDIVCPIIIASEAIEVRKIIDRRYTHSGRQQKEENTSIARKTLG